MAATQEPVVREWGCVRADTPIQRRTAVICGRRRYPTVAPGPAIRISFGDSGIGFRSRRVSILTQRFKFLERENGSFFIQRLLELGPEAMRRGEKSHVVESPISRLRQPYSVRPTLSDPAGPAWSPTQGAQGAGARGG